MKILKTIVFGCFFTLISCGGGGGGGNVAPTSIDVSPSSLDFANSLNSISSKVVSVTFKGDGLVVGYPTGFSAASWLALGSSINNTSPTNVILQASSSGLAAGKYSTTVRFLTGKQDGSNLVYKDVPVTMIVKEGASITTEVLNFSALESLSPESLAFAISTKSATAWTLSTQYFGTETNWLHLSQTHGDLAENQSSNISMSASGLRQGDYSAVITLNDSSGNILDTLTVNYKVISGVSIDQVQEKRIDEKASIEDLTWTVPVQSLYGTQSESSVNWNVSSDQDWLKIESGSGKLSDLKNINMTLDSQKLLTLQKGMQSALLTISFDNPNISPIKVPLTLNINIDAKLVLSERLFFTINNNSVDSDLQKNIQVGLNVGTAFAKNIKWHADVQSQWLTAINTDGDVNTNNTITFKVNKDYVSSLDRDLDSATIYIIPEDTAYKQYWDLVALKIKIPQILAVSPYVGFTNQSGPLLITGNNFTGNSKLQVDFDGILVDATIVDDKTLSVNYPQITTAKSVKLKIPGALNLDRSKATFLINESQVYTYSKVTFDGAAYSFILDPERQAVLFAGNYSNKVVRLKYDGQNWLQDSFGVPQAQGIALSLDGKKLMISSGGLGETDSIIEANPDSFSIAKSTALVNDFYDAYGIILPMAYERTLIADTDQWASIVSYPEMQQFVAPSMYGVKSFMTRDRSRTLLIGNYDARYLYDAKNSEFTPVVVNTPGNIISLDQSTDGSRLVTGAAVYDKNISLLGFLNPILNNFRLAAVTPNGKYAYVLYYKDPYYTYDPSNQNVLAFKRYDILNSQGPFMAEDLNSFVVDPGEYPLYMRVSDDGGALFLLTLNSNDQRTMYVYPLN